MGLAGFQAKISTSKATGFRGFRDCGIVGTRFRGRNVTNFKKADFSADSAWSCDIQFFHPAAQRIRMHIENLRRAGGSFNSPVRVLQH